MSDSDRRPVPADVRGGRLGSAPDGGHAASRAQGRRHEAARSGGAVLDAETVIRLLDPIIPEKNRHEFAEKHDTDFAYEIPGLARFRANIFMDRKGTGAVFRVIPSKILTAEQLGLSPADPQPLQAEQGARARHRARPAPASRRRSARWSTTSTRRATTTSSPSRIRSSSCTRTSRALINQREVHNHTMSFKGALRAALREDPDIILVGEMRDLETVAIAIETAETGHLVFGTLHTSTAASTVDRVIDQFPADRQAQIRVMLSESLKGVISQTLCKKIGGGRVAALEVLIVTSASAT